MTTKCTMPQSLEAEAALLSACMSEADRLAKCAATLTAEHFYQRSHQFIFRKVLALHTAGQVVDQLTVTQALKDAGQLEEIGGAHYVSQVAMSTATSAHTDYYIGILVEKFNLRRIIEAAEAATREAYAGQAPAAEVAGRMKLFVSSLGEVIHESESEALSRCVLSGADLAALQVEPRETILAPFFKAGDYGIVFAKRGTGKTWLAMGMAEAIASGGRFGPYEAPKARRLTYIDGENALDDTQGRSRALAGGGISNVSFVHHEVFFQRSERTLNLAERETQDAITQLVVRDGVEVLILDNLSCLMHGMAENDADDWGRVLPWLLHLRRLKVAVVLVAHAGRNGQIRGTSKREDAASWALGLNRIEGEDGDGAMKFTTAFSKNRNCLDDAAPPLAWTLRISNGAASVTTSELSGVDALVQWVEAGLEACHEIAEEMGLSKGTTSKMAKKAHAQGRIKIEGRRYLPVTEGGAA